MQECNLAPLFDKHFPDHGHWKGISGGKLAVGWLLYILSEAGHRQMTQLKENQLKILTLLDMPDAYQRVWNILETQLALCET